ncbi:MAG: Pycsar system effector family protein [Tsuneonella sp.]
MTAAAEPNAAPGPPEAEAAPPKPFATNAVQMLRNAQSSTLTLSQMADQKASILMGATFVVFSLSVGRALASNGGLPWSLSVLAFFAFLSALCGVSAVLPSVRTPRPNPAFVPNKMFFGHFATRDEEEWTQEILADLRSEEAMFRMMLHDIYQNGQVLHRKKYRFLGYAYRLFIAGLVATMATFAIEIIAKV